MEAIMHVYFSYSSRKKNPELVCMTVVRAVCSVFLMCIWAVHSSTSEAD